jgi:hypothetical protein
MKIKSKIISFLSVSVLIVSFSVNSFAAEIPFSDLEGVGAREKITMLQQEGYIDGIAEGVFAPYKVLTAAEGISLMVKALGLNLDTVRFIKEPKATDYYSKADNDAWYANALITAAVNGLEFPKDMDMRQELSREEFTYYLISGIEKKGNLPMINIIPAKIADEEALTIEYSGAIQRALIYKVVNLDSEGKINPKAKISRSEAAEQIYNALAYLKAHPAPVLE